MEMSSNDLVTIIIPTINRLQWIERSLEFYNKKKFKHPIFIGDSSNLKNFNLLKKKVNKYKNVQVSLFHLPNLTAEQVIYNLSKLVNTNYSTFLADDDIIFPKFFDLSVKHLSKDKNLIGVTGKGYCYSLEGNRLKGKIISFGDYPIIDAQEENFYERILSNFNSNFACVFTIVRTSIFTEAFSKVNKLNQYHQTFILGELQCAIEYLKKGKIKKLNVPFIIRQQHHQNNYGNRSLNKWLINDFHSSYKIINNNLQNLKISKIKRNILNNKFDEFLTISINKMCEKESNISSKYKKKITLKFNLKFFLIKLFFTCNLKYKELLLVFRYLSKC